MSAHDILMSAAGGTSLAANYVEDVFSTYLYTGNGSTQTITNGIDLAGEGGLVWLKKRGVGTGDHHLYDTVRGATNMISSNTTGGTIVRANGLTAFNSNGFSIGAYSEINGNGDSQASWTFRKQPKFFDVVTYTGNGSSNQSVAHSLGSTPGAIFIKATSASGNWGGWIRTSDTSGRGAISLNSTAASAQALPTSMVCSASVFYPYWLQDFDTNIGNQSGTTYVAYLFAHNAGGFGLTGEDNVISCGSYTVVAGMDRINLGYEAQFVMMKRVNATGGWQIFDSMRSRVSNTDYPDLFANTSAAESTSGASFAFTSTGFELNDYSAGDVISYIAIRRGPMKVPTVGTSVFAPRFGANSANQYISTGFNPDLAIHRQTVGASQNNFFQPRLTGQSSTSQNVLWSNSTSAEISTADRVYFGPVSNGYNIQNARTDALTYAMLRAPGFFDVVCYTGTGVARTVAHNLSAVPELMIVKKRDSILADVGWVVWNTTFTTTNAILQLNSSDATVGSNAFNSTPPTSSVLTLGNNLGTNYGGSTYVAYLFATCAGVSKVGSYTGTGTTLQINCGFTAGARFVLIKRTDATGDWYIWDSARGIVAGNDPYLLLNSSAAEVTSTDYIDPVSSGFEISSTAPAAINASGGSFIFLAIA